MPGEAAMPNHASTPDIAKTAPVNIAVSSCSFLPLKFREIEASPPNRA